MLIHLTYVTFFLSCISVSVVYSGDIRVYSGGTRQHEGWKVKGRPGGSITITFIVNSADFRMFEVQYNGSYNSYMMGPNIINDDDVKDPRLSYVDVSKRGVSTGIQIKLRLSLIHI